MESSAPGDTSVLRAFFAQNTWANLKLLAFCAELPAEQLDATTVGTYGSIAQTLLHTLVAEVGYVNRVNGKSPATPLPRDTFPGFPALDAAARWAGDELLALALAARADMRVR